MPITKEEVSYEFKIDLDKYVPKEQKKLSRNEKDELKEIIGEHLINNILMKVSDSISPVTGKKFKKLNEAYANREKNGDRSANLELYGSMLNALEVESTDKGIMIGVFDDDEAIKLYNHNVGDTLPKRQVIPDKGQNFTKVVQKGIDEIIKDYLEER
jgi:hypothetical protein